MPNFVTYTIDILLISTSVWFPKLHSERHTLVSLSKTSNSTIFTDSCNFDSFCKTCSHSKWFYYLHKYNRRIITIWYLQLKQTWLTESIVEPITIAGGLRTPSPFLYARILTAGRDWAACISLFKERTLVIFRSLINWESHIANVRSASWFVRSTFNTKHSPNEVTVGLDECGYFGMKSRRF